MHAGRQATLAEFGVGPASLLEPLTDPPRYLSSNYPPTTEPTYIANVPPPPPRAHTTEYEPPGEQLTLSDCTGACPYCTAAPENFAKHVLMDHPEELSAHISQLAAEKAREPDDTQREDPVEPEPNGPVMYGVAGKDHNGQDFDAPDARTCEACGERVSKRFAKVFGFDEHGVDRLCRDCNPRSRRFSMDPSRQGYVGDVDTVTGASNPQSSDNAPRSAE